MCIKIRKQEGIRNRMDMRNKGPMLVPRAPLMVAVNNMHVAERGSEGAAVAARLPSSRCTETLAAD